MSAAAARASLMCHIITPPNLFAKVDSCRSLHGYHDTGLMRIVTGIVLATRSGARTTAG